MLSLSFIGTGCSDAAKVGNSLEKICKAQCDCPEVAEDWNDISNCKKACEGYSIAYTAYLADNRTEPACDELDTILKDLENCNSQCSTSDSYYDYDPACIEVAQRLYECWPAEYDNYTPYPYGGYGASAEEQAEQKETLQRLLHPIPVASVSSDTLHQASI